MGLEAFIAVLREYGILLLADIRTVPRSRTNPQYNLDSLPAALAAEGISYRHFPRLGGLKGRRKDQPGGAAPNTARRNTSFRNYADYALTPPFTEGLDELMAVVPAPKASMCAEAVWWRCHRRIVSDYLLLRGVPVLDTIPPNPPTPHEMTPFAHSQSDGAIHYAE
ncbi:MAG: DUF488 domain-containing protein [Chloroflexia bacterium]